MTTVSSKDALTNVATLLSITKDDLSKALCQRVIAARGEVLEKGHTENEALFGRDAFAKVNNSGNVSKYLQQR